MKLSRKQRKELEAIEFFMPDWCTFEPYTDEDLETFFAWSDRGIPYLVNEDNKLSGLASLHYGKQYRDLHITMYLDDIKNGQLFRQELSDMPEWVLARI